MAAVGILLMVAALVLCLAGTLPIFKSIRLRATLMASMLVVGFPGCALYTEAVDPSSEGLANFLFGYFIMILLAVVFRALLIWKLNWIAQWEPLASDYMIRKGASKGLTRSRRYRRLVKASNRPPPSGRDLSYFLLVGPLYFLLRRFGIGPEMPRPDQEQEE